MDLQDLKVTFPGPGRIRIRSKALFGDATGHVSRRFANHVMASQSVLSLSIRGHRSNSRRKQADIGPVAEVHYCAKSRTRQQAVQEICKQLLAASADNVYYDTNPEN